MRSQYSASSRKCVVTMMVTAALDHGVDALPEVAPRQRIDARGRLVEEQHRRLRASTAQASASLCLKPERQARPHWVSSSSLQRELIDDAGDGGAAARAGNAIDAGEEGKVLAQAEIAIEENFCACSRSARAPPRRAIEDRGLRPSRLPEVGSRWPHII